MSDIRTASRIPTSGTIAVLDRTALRANGSEVQLEPHEWYEWIAKFYRDTAADKARRQRAAELLDLRAGKVVLAPGCGAGFDFPLLVPAIAGRTQRLDQRDAGSRRRLLAESRLPRALGRCPREAGAVEVNGSRGFIVAGATKPGVPFRAGGGR